jgi:hypothetical protein
MAALHLDNLLFLLFIAIAIFFQILTRVATKARKRPGDTTPRSTPPSQMSRPIPREPDDTDEQRIRKFLEALGQPTSSTPPAPVSPRPSYQRPIVLPHVPPPLRSPLPPLTTRPPESEPFQPTVAEAPALVRKRPAPVEPPPVIATASEAYAIAPQSTSKSADARTNLATMLRSTSGLRDAIILREIFGPPRSLQPLDLVGGI